MILSNKYLEKVAGEHVEDLLQENVCRSIKMNSYKELNIGYNPIRACIKIISGKTLILDLYEAHRVADRVNKEEENSAKKYYDKIYFKYKAFFDKK